MNNDDLETKVGCGIFGLVGLGIIVQLALWVAVIWALVKVVQHFT